MRKPLITLFAFVVLVVAGCGGGSDKPSGQSSSPSSAEPTLHWPAPPDPLDRTAAAGLKAENKEHLTYHVHAHLDVFIDGDPVIVPAGIGINIKDPGVMRFNDTPDGSTSYGGIKQCGQPCISPLHTHDDTGILHTESATPTPNTLGQFFTEWGVRLSPTCVGDLCSPKHVAFYVDGKPYSGDPAAIQLTYQKEIAVVIGKPPAQIPDTADFSQA